MDIVLVIFGPMVLSFVILAIMPADIRYLLVLAAAIGLCGWMALAPLPPSSGPDDWYRGIGRAGGQFGLMGAAATILPQAARRFVPLGIGGYGAALVAACVVGFVLVTSLGSF